jgi:hypothetical protein
MHEDVLADVARRLFIAQQPLRATQDETAVATIQLIECGLPVSAPWTANHSP